MCRGPRRLTPRCMLSRCPRTETRGGQASPCTAALLSLCLQFASLQSRFFISCAARNRRESKQALKVGSAAGSKEQAGGPPGRTGRHAAGMRMVRLSTRVLRRRCTVAVAQQRRASAVLGFAQQAADAPQHGSRGAARCRRRACAGPGSVYAGGANTSAPRAHARLPALLEAHDWVRLGASGAQALWHCSAACYGSLGMLALMHRSTRPSLCSLVVPFDEAGRHGSTGTLWTSPSCAAWCTTRAALTRGCCCCARTSAQKVGELWHVKGQRPA